MKILILKTTIDSKKKLKLVTPVLDKTSAIWDWCVDREDIDNILRIEASDTINENDIILLLKDYGIICEELSDDILV